MLALACLVLTLGPELKIAGWLTSLPLPYALIQDLPGIRSGQRPNHMAVMVSLSLSALVAWGVVVVQQMLTRRVLCVRGWHIAVGLIVLVAGVDGYAGTHTIVERPMHPFYATLPPPDGALMPLLLYININRSENLTAQMGHGWPIIGGYVARPPTYPFARYTPGVREIQFGEVERRDVVLPGWPESAQRALAAYRTGILQWISGVAKTNTLRVCVLSLSNWALEHQSLPAKPWKSTLRRIPGPLHWLRILVADGSRSNVNRKRMFAGAGWVNAPRCDCIILTTFQRRCA